MIPRSSKCHSSLLAFAILELLPLSPSCFPSRHPHSLPTLRNTTILPLYTSSKCVTHPFSPCLQPASLPPLQSSSVMLPWTSTLLQGAMLPSSTMLLHSSISSENFIKKVWPIILKPTLSLLGFRIPSMPTCVRSTMTRRLVFFEVLGWDCAGANGA